MHLPGRWLYMRGRVFLWVSLPYLSYFVLGAYIIHPFPLQCGHIFDTGSLPGRFSFVQPRPWQALHATFIFFGLPIGHP